MPPEVVVKPEQIIPIERVARSLNVSKATISKMSKAGTFPAPIKLPIRKNLYLLSDIEEWWRERLGRLGHPFPLAPEDPADDDQHHPRAAMTKAPGIAVAVS